MEPGEAAHCSRSESGHAPDITRCGKKVTLQQKRTSPCFGSCSDSAVIHRQDGAAPGRRPVCGGATINRIARPRAGRQLLAGYYVINTFSGKVLDDPDFSTSNGIQMDQWQRNGGLNQQWFLVPA
jgi:hypothetical protein